MELISMFLGVAGFCLSVAIWARTLYQERKKLSAAIDFSARFTTVQRGEKTLKAVCGFFFQNKSTSPVSITHILLCFENGETVRAELTPQYVGCSHLELDAANDISYTRFVESADFPIELAGKGASFQYVAFIVPVDAAAEVEKIEICTTRGVLRMEDEKSRTDCQAFLEKGLAAPISSGYVPGIHAK